jgi:sacsin
MADSFDKWTSFGQRIDICSRIREILINYPEGTSLLKEIVQVTSPAPQATRACRKRCRTILTLRPSWRCAFQNADDAGAKKLVFLLDHRHHAASTLAYEKLAAFQGPALCVFNDGVFRESDFESISRIGDSVKREEAGKTGRFGVGFNSCYHLTDLPSFVSGRHLVIFDPHCENLVRDTNKMTATLGPCMARTSPMHLGARHCQTRQTPFAALMSWRLAAA